MSTKETIENRDPTYGNFAHRSRIAMGIKNAMMLADGWSRLTDSQKQALQTIADKISRILNGDPNHLDSWHDIGGYALLIEEEIQHGERNRKQVAMFREEDLPGDRVSEIEFRIEDIATIAALKTESIYRPELGAKDVPHKFAEDFKEQIRATVTGPALCVDTIHKTDVAMMARPKDGCTCPTCRPELVHASPRCGDCWMPTGRVHANPCTAL